MAQKSCCYVGRGKVLIQKHEASCPTTAAPWGTALTEVGNTESMAVTVDENTVDVKDFTTSSGGIECSFTDIEGIELAMEIRCISPRNLAIAFGGSESDVSSSAIVDETHRVNDDCEVIIFKELYDTSIAPVVTDVGGATTYVAGTDYDLTPNGLQVNAAGSIATAADIEIDYTSKAHVDIEGLVSSQDFYRVVLDGVNAHDGLPMRMELHKVRFKPAGGFDFIGEDFSTLSLTGEVLKWDCITDPAKSKFLKVKFSK